MTAGLPPVVSELSDAYANFMVNPRPGPRVCDVCFTFCGPGFQRCVACARAPARHLAAVLPISFSIEGRQLHHALRSYKGRGMSVGSGAASRFES